MLGSVEAVLGDHYRDGEVGDLARVVSVHPTDRSTPWVRLTLIDELPVTEEPYHLVQYRVQADCYGGATNGQADADLISRTVLATAAAAAGTHAALVITAVRPAGRLRLPDPDMRPARERYVCTLNVWAHP